MSSNGPETSLLQDALQCIAMLTTEMRHKDEELQAVRHSCDYIFRKLIEMEAKLSEVNIELVNLRERNQQLEENRACAKSADNDAQGSEDGEVVPQTDSTSIPDLTHATTSNPSSSSGAGAPLTPRPDNHRFPGPSPPGHHDGLLNIKREEITEFKPGDGEWRGRPGNTFAEDVSDNLLSSEPPVVERISPRKPPSAANTGKNTRPSTPVATGILIDFNKTDATPTVSPIQESRTPPSPTPYQNLLAWIARCDASLPSRKMIDYSDIVDTEANTVSSFPTETQSLVTYSPAADDKDIYRTVMATNGIPSAGFSSFLGDVCGGPLLSVKYLDTRSIYGSYSAMIVFVRENDARKLVEHAKSMSQVPKSENCAGSITYTLVGTPTHPVNDREYVAIRNRQTRVIALYSPDDPITDENIRHLAELHRHVLSSDSIIISITRPEEHLILVETPSIDTADWLIKILAQISKTNSLRAYFAPDPCDRPVRLELERIQQQKRRVLTNGETVELVRGSVPTSDASQWCEETPAETTTNNEVRRGRSPTARDRVQMAGRNTDPWVSASSFDADAADESSEAGNSHEVFDQRAFDDWKRLRGRAQKTQRNAFRVSDPVASRSDVEDSDVESDDEFEARTRLDPRSATDPDEAVPDADHENDADMETDAGFERDTEVDTATIINTHAATINEASPVAEPTPNTASLSAYETNMKVLQTKLNACKKILEDGAATVTARKGAQIRKLWVVAKMTDLEKVEKAKRTENDLLLFSDRE